MGYLKAEIDSVEYLFHSMTCAWASLLATPKGTSGREEAWALLSPTMMDIEARAYAYAEGSDD